MEVHQIVISSSMRRTHHEDWQGTTTDHSPRSPYKLTSVNRRSMTGALPGFCRDAASQNARSEFQTRHRRHTGPHRRPRDQATELVAGDTQAWPLGNGIPLPRHEFHIVESWTPLDSSSLPGDASILRRQLQLHPFWSTKARLWEWLRRTKQGCVMTRSAT